MCPYLRVPGGSLTYREAKALQPPPNAIRVACSWNQITSENLERGGEVGFRSCFFVLRAPFRSLGLMVSVFRILCFRAAGFHYLGSWLGLLWLGFSAGGGLGPSTLIKF